MGRLKDDVRAMKHFLNMSLPDGAPAAAATGGGTRGGVLTDGSATGPPGAEPWGRTGSRDVDVDAVRSTHAAKG